MYKRQDQGDAVLPGERGIGDEGRKRGMEEGFRRNHRDLVADAVGDDLDALPEPGIGEQRLDGGVRASLGLELVPAPFDGPDDGDEPDDRPELVEIAFHGGRGFGTRR